MVSLSLREYGITKFHQKYQKQNINNKSIESEIEKCLKGTKLILLETKFHFSGKNKIVFPPAT